MDAGSNDYTNNQFRIRLRAPTKPSGENLDRFIPNRSAMNFDYADYALTKRMKGKENQVVVCSPSRQAYRKRLAEALDMNYSRILAFKNKPAAVIDPIPKEFFSRSAQQSKPTKSQRCIPKTPKMILKAPQILDDFYLNLMDWGSANVLAVALSDAVYLWNATDATVSELVTVDAEDAPVSCVSWAPDGCHIAIGLRNSHVQIWDATATKLLRTIRWGHQSQVNALAWNHHLLTTGGIDGKIINNDVRVREHVVETYKGHRKEVCGLKWSASGRQLASGGSDNLVLIWDRCMTPSNSARQWVHRLEEHTSAIKALAWCPFQGNLLASGGGVDDRCIKFWNTATGICLKSVDTGSQVCSLLWSKHERELCSSHGFTQNQLTLWEYPSMVKMAELTGHTSRVLFADQSPDGYTVATAAGDETVRFWNVFGSVLKAKSEPFAHLSGIR